MSTLIVKLVKSGPQGAPGPGVPDGGTTDQILSKASDDNQDTHWVDPGGSGATEKEYTQALHGFTVLDPVYWDDAAWAGADAADAVTLGQGVVTEVIDENTFKVAIAGFYTSVGHGLTPDHYHYVAEGGGWTIDEPLISHPLIYVVDADNYIVFPYRPSNTSYLMKTTDETYSGFSEAEVTHVTSGGGTVTINYLAANGGGNTHVISEDTSGTIVIAIGDDWPDAHDAVTLKIDPTNLTGLTWADQASFVNVGAGLDYEACVAFDAGTAGYVIRIEEIGGELFYFESSIL